MYLLSTAKHVYFNLNTDETVTQGGRQPLPLIIRPLVV